MNQKKWIAAAFGATDAVTSPLDAVETEALARNIEKLLGCEIEHARRIGTASAARARAVERLRRAPLPAPALIVPADAGVLALPFTTEAVLLLNSIRRPMLIESTSETRILEPLFAGRAELVTSDVMLRRNRDAGPRPLFVTFPDHHLTSDGTTRTVPFLGSAHHFSLVELLLLVRGAAPIVTMRAANGHLQLVAWDAEVDRSSVSEAHALAFVRWLAEQVESVIRSKPECVLSWRAIAQCSASAVRQRRIMDGRLLQALVRVGPTLPTDIRARALARLRLIEEGDAA
jgi:hypothetical protein